jgi:hypothetical protein
MTQDEQEETLEIARAIIITLTPQGWTVSRMAHGSPYTRRTEPTLALALAHICQPKKG